MKLTKANSTALAYGELIPPNLVSKDGVSINTADSVWRIDINGSINWNLASSLPPELLFPMRAYVCHVLMTMSGATARIVFTLVVRRAGKVDPIKLASAIKDGISVDLYYLLKASLQADPGIGESSLLDSLSHFRRWYLWCVDCELQGFDDESALELADMVIGGPPKGAFVLQADPEFGPLTFAQDTKLEAAISCACDRRDESSNAVLQACVAVILSKAFGLYAGHLQRLNEDDFSVETLSDGGRLYWLRVPRLKKRGQRAKVGTRKRRLTSRTAEVIELLCLRNFEERVKRGCGTSSQDKDPLFVRDEAREVLSGTSLESDAFRWTKQEFISAMNSFCSDHHIDFRISPRRLRYSFATRLVEEGCSPMELADALDHSDLQHVMVYFNSRGRVVRQLDEALAVRLAPLAGAFLGRIVPGRLGPNERQDSKSTIRFSLAGSAGTPDVGDCGANRRCGLNVPLACYTCYRFEPWDSAPHREVLASLIVERKRRFAAGLDEKLIQIHDPTILAVAEVVRRLEHVEPNSDSLG